MKALFALLGVVLCLAGLGLLMLGSSVFADARSAAMTGPGISLWLLDRWPAPGGQARIEVEGHGGDRSGIRHVSVLRGGTELASASGEGVTWGSTISSGKSRGSASLQVPISIPADAPVGQPLRLEVKVDYVCAMSAGVGSFDNVSYSDVLALEIVPVAPGGGGLARVLHVLPSLGVLAAWALLIAVAVRLLKRYDGAEHGQSLGVALIGFAICGGIVGYWTFARPISVALGNPAAVEVLLTIGYLTVVPYGSYRLARRSPSASLASWKITAVSESTGSIAQARLAQALRQAGLIVRVKSGRFSARDEGTTRVEVRGPDPVTLLSQLQVSASRVEPVVHLGAALAEAFGAVVVTGPSLTVTVKPGERADQVLQNETEKLMREVEEMRKMLAERMRAPR